MTDHLNPGLVCLIVWHNGAEGGFRYAIVDDLLLDVALTRSQESGAASTAVEHSSSAAPVQRDSFILRSLSMLSRFKHSRTGVNNCIC